jgi:hypothetical protein
LPPAAGQRPNPTAQRSAGRAPEAADVLLELLDPRGERTAPGGLYRPRTDDEPRRRIRARRHWQWTAEVIDDIRLRRVCGNAVLEVTR